MTNSFTLAGHTIGPQAPCFVIAEAGVNHNGDADLARQLVHAAKATGAQCVKFQTFTADQIVTEDAPKAKYQLKTTNPQESQKAMLKQLELPEAAYREVIDLCTQANLVFLSTPYSLTDIDFLDDLGVAAFKFASMHIFEPSLLRYAATKGKPLIVSTGMATLAEVERGLAAIRETGNEDVVLLQCTTNYPSAPADANLRAMVTMGDELDVLVGYSDHTQTDTACLAATALGACVIEKHFTLDKAMPGPDQSTSYDQAEFTRLVQGIHETTAVLGSGVKEPCAAEQANATGMRRSIVAQVAIPAGTVITADMVTFKRPATGLTPEYFDQVVGAKALSDIAADEILTTSTVALPSP